MKAMHHTAYSFMLSAKELENCMHTMLQLRENFIHV
jgi:hypothetical protein